MFSEVERLRKTLTPQYILFFNVVLDTYRYFYNFASFAMATEVAGFPRVRHGIIL